MAGAFEIKMGSPIFDSTFGTGRFENREFKEKSMTNLEALRKVWNMANHSIDLGGRPWTDEEREALEKAKRLIEDGKVACPELNGENEK
jgi:hypothetical protein